MSKAKTETDAMAIAFAALRGQNLAVENRMMVWLAHRLHEHRRGREVEVYKQFEATEWRIHFVGEEALTCATKDECLEEWHSRSVIGPGEFVEITAHAAVHQEFVVAVLIGDHEGMVEGHEFPTFPTRAEAEAYAASMKAEATADAAGQGVALA